MARGQSAEHETTGDTVDSIAAAKLKAAEAAKVAEDLLAAENLRNLGARGAGTTEEAIAFFTAEAQASRIKIVKYLQAAAAETAAHAKDLSAAEGLRNIGAEANGAEEAIAYFNTAAEESRVAMGMYLKAIEALEGQKTKGVPEEKS